MMKRTARLSAFTLTEVAIVLGVLGSVLIGIWAAFNSINENNQANRTYAIITEIVSNIRTTYNNQAPVNMPAANTRITSQLNTLGIFPSDLVFNNTGNPDTDWVETTWGGRIQMLLIPSAGMYGRGPGFMVDFFRLTVAQCIRLATNLTQNRNDRMTWIILNGGTPIDLQNNPPDEATIAQGCNANAQAHLGMGFLF